MYARMYLGSVCMFSSVNYVCMYALFACLYVWSVGLECVYVCIFCVVYVCMFCMYVVFAMFVRVACTLCVYAMYVCTFCHPLCIWCVCMSSMVACYVWLRYLCVLYICCVCYVCMHGLRVWMNVCDACMLRVYAM